MRSAHEHVAATARATARERLLIAARGGRAMDGAGDQLSSLVDASRALSAAGITHALIGGIAVGIHSEVPRATQDIDLAVDSTVPRETVVAALEAAGFELTGEFPHSLNLRHAGVERLQVAMDPFFDQMIERADTVEVGGVPIHVVTRDDLIAMKERSAADPSRHPSKALRDRADIEMLRGDVPDPDEGW
jgi:predicted nucleotidyltransferase